MQNSKSYFVLPNTAFGLSSEEFSVLAYLLSILTAKKRVRQSTIAEKCNISSRNTRHRYVTKHGNWYYRQLGKYRAYKQDTENEIRLPKGLFG